ncbi:MAG: hypothetical protein WEC79_08205 [Thermomicrobiales bacterium]
MIRMFPAFFLAVLLSVAVIACGGGDDSPDDATPASTPKAAGTTPAIALTPTTSAEATTASGSPEPNTFTDREGALIDLLLAASELPGSWTQTSLEAPEVSGGPGICDAPSFPLAEERVAAVEVEYQSVDGERFVVEGITEFLEDIAVQAMEYIRDTATCSEWTDDSGTVFEVSQAEAPDLGDDSHALHVAFEVEDSRRLEGDFFFVRVNGFVAIVTTLELDGYDPEFSSQIANLAAGKIEGLAGTGSDVTDDESAAMAGLLTLDDLSDEWDQPRPAHRSEPESWTGLCDEELFPDHDEAIARVGVELYEGFVAESATILQLLVLYPTGLGSDAFDYEQESASCDQFTSGAFDVTLAPADEFPALGDESFAVRFTFENSGAAVEGYWIVILDGDVLTTLIYTDPDALVDEDAEEIAETAADRMTNAVR